MANRTTKVFQNRIAQYMADHHMDDAYVLEHTNISRDTFYRLKRKGFANLNADTAHELAALWGIPFERLFYIADKD